ncbi:MAG: TIGR03435 family protein, partial [Bryobacteraceae bacterium]
IPPGTEPLSWESGDNSFGIIGYAGGQWTIFATSMPQLAKFAADYILRVPVIDRTELSGRFNYRQRVPDIDPQYTGDQSASFRDYLQELGLKLERAKGPVETLVIDHAEKASPN